MHTVSKGIHRHAEARTGNTPSLGVCWSSDTGQSLRSRSSWYSRGGWTGQSRRNLPDTYHTWPQQHFSESMTTIIIVTQQQDAKLAKVKEAKMFFTLIKWSHLAETPPCVWVAHTWCDTILVTVTTYTVREAIISCSAAITLPATNSWLTAMQKYTGQNNNIKCNSVFTFQDRTWLNTFIVPGHFFPVIKLEMVPELVLRCRKSCSLSHKIV